MAVPYDLLPIGIQVLISALRWCNTSIWRPCCLHGHESDAGPYIRPHSGENAQLRLRLYDNLSKTEKSDFSSEVVNS